ncbi:MAG TPA: 30S ribosome-binding factor RbfA [Eubacteriaceae bacterium]|mgnify:FL=1|jgi:ribosome-binding factor A|nr:30S ribosome-binding factor RbfA [Eubacteriaceae bacterium]
MARRMGRLNEEIKKELSNLIKNQIKDPRVADFVSITQVETTNDLRYAKVFVSIYGNEKQQEETLLGLRSAGGYLRREIGKNIKLRYTPELLFEIDNSIEYGMHINSILNKIKKDDENKDN